ncbi:MAG: DUF6861 domain-containing protein [Acidobacteriota bacterium]
MKAYFLARYKYVWQMVFEETGRSLKEFLDGMIQGLLMMLIVIASTTALGTAAGAAIGALFGGVGAGPGALIGAEAGLNFGVFVLNWLGIGFLIVYVAANFGEVLKLVSAGVERAWYAGKRLQPEQTDIDEAAKDIARGIAVLFRLILEGIVMYLLAKGTAAVAERLPGLIKSLKDSKLGKGFAEWVERNHRSLIEDPKTNPQLRKSPTSPTEGTVKPENPPSKSTAPAANAAPKKIQVSPKRKAHILDGDATGGGHGPGRGTPGKSEFPGSLTDDQVIAGVEAIANDPAKYPGGKIPTSGRVKLSGEINGVKTTVIVEPAGEGVITAWPEGMPRNPKQ